MKYFKSTLITGIIFTLLLSVAQTSSGHTDTSVSHSGGTDECGCHTNRKTGEYHCHKRKKRGGSCPPVAKNKEVKDRTRDTTFNVDTDKSV